MWSRVIVSAVGVGVILVRDSELAELRQQVQELKKIVDVR